MVSSATGLWKLFRDQAERRSGIGRKLFGFIAESVSLSSRNTVRNHPGIAFIFDRIPHAYEEHCAEHGCEAESLVLSSAAS